MKLRTYLVASAVLVVGIVLVVFAVWTRSVTDSGARQVSAAQVRQLSEVVRGALEARFSVLRDFCRVLRVDNDLSRAFLLARETRDTHLIQSKLDRVRESSRFDLVEILSFNDATFGLLDSRSISPLLSAAEAGKQDLVVVRTRKGPAVAFYSAIEHYGSPVGALFIGYLLDGRLKTELESLTASDVDLRAGPASQDAILTIPIGSEMLTATIAPKQAIGDGIGLRVMRGTLLAGSLCLGLLVLLFTLVLELGFFRRFRRLVFQGHQLAEAVTRGETPVHHPIPGRIRENNTVDHVLSRFADSIGTYQRIIEEKSAAVAESERQASLARMARDIAHNIGSSLTTLEANVPQLAAAPEQVRSAVRKATREIRDRIEALRSQAKAAETAAKPSDDAATPPARRPRPMVVQQLASLVEEVASERRSALRVNDRVEITAETGESAYGAFAKIEIDEFRAILANLIKNAVEAIPTTGTVTVRVQREDAQAAILVTDTGTGVAPELLPRLAQRGVTHGKANGSGLGLSHASVTLEAWGGSLKIESAFGQGTTVRLVLPQATPPSWFVPALSLERASTICVLDDDDSIHALWDLRFAPAQLPAGTMKHFRDGDSFSAWVTRNAADVPRTQFLVDYELIGEHRNGLDLIEALGIEDRAVLVTGRFDEPTVLSRAKFIGVKVLPKPLAGLVPVRVAAEECLVL